MILNDREIRDRIINEEMIKPYSLEQVRHQNDSKIVSFGLASYGYDIRLSDEFKHYPIGINHSVVDPKVNWLKNIKPTKTDCCIIPPNSFVLGLSIEELRIPRDIMAICVGKSTYARCGIIANVTPLEPEWRGRVVVEISNTTPLPAKVYANEGILQILFLKGEGCDISYADKKGKYQDQTNIEVKV